MDSTAMIRLIVIIAVTAFIILRYEKLIKE